MTPLLAAALAASAGVSRAQLHIETARPRCGQPGTTVAVVLKGRCLDDPQEIIFHRPGIRAVNLSAETDEKFASTLTCRFEIAADCRLGEHPFRVRTRRELTTAQTFHVTPFPVVDEAEQPANSNDTRDKAVPLTPHVTVRGHLVATHARDDVDWYRVSVEKNRRLSVEVESVRTIDSPFFYPQSRVDLKLRVVDAAGRELAANDDNDLRIQDPLVSFVPAEDGVVFIEVRRSFFLANADYPYVLHVGGHRRPLAAFPPGGPAGQPLSVRFLGDPLGPFDETVGVPAKTGTFDWFGDAPTPLSLRSSAMPNVLEDAAAAATPVPALPAAVNGILEAPGDVDAFRLSAKKGDRYLVRVYAATLGSPVDATIRIRPVGPGGEPGAVELESDDATLLDREIFGTAPYSGSMVPDTLDPSVVWEPKADGDYLLQVSDRFGGGATHVYRVEIDPPPPVVYVCLGSSMYDWVEGVRTTSLAVPRGGRWTVNLWFRPGQGNLFRGDMEVEAHGLPPGLRMLPSRIPGGQATDRSGVFRWPVTLEADAAAPEAAAVVTFSVKAVDPAIRLESRCQQMLPFANLSGGDAWRTVRLDNFVAGIVAPVPVSLAVESPSAALLRAAELTLPVRITRQPGFEDPVDVSFGLLPPGCAGSETMRVPAGESEVMVRLQAKADAPLGSHPLFFVCQTGGSRDGYNSGLGHNRVASPTVSVTIAEPYIELASDGPQTIRRGERKRYVWKVRHKNPLPGEAQVRLKNLPKGVRLIEPLPRITKDSPEVAFDIEATDDALLGSVKGITCEVIMQLAGQEVRQEMGSGLLRIDPRL